MTNNEWVTKHVDKLTHILHMLTTRALCEGHCSVRARSDLLDKNPYQQYQVITYSSHLSPLRPPEGDLRADLGIKYTENWSSPLDGLKTFFVPFALIGLICLC